MSISRPAKWEIREFAKLVDMLDFLKEKYRPFTAIAREAIKRGIIKRSADSFYHIFTSVVHHVGIFEGQFYPDDQTPTGKSRWEWKLPENITRKEFMRIIHDYVRRHFRTPLRYR